MSSRLDNLGNGFIRLILESGLQIGVVVFFISSTMALSLYYRQLIVDQNLFSEESIRLILSASLKSAAFAVATYKISRFGFLQIISWFMHTETKSENQQSIISSTLYYAQAIFSIIAILLATHPLRPIFQQTIMDGPNTDIDVAFVRYDAMMSLSILIIFSLPVLYLAWKSRSRQEQLVSIGMILAFSGYTIYANQAPNFPARVYEARESMKPESLGS